jgi:hypothetical protein
VKTIRMLQIIGPAFAMAISGLAQETLNYGTISGVVTDPSGAVIHGAEITARQTEINLTAQSNHRCREGRFRLRYLRVGPYEITVHQSGFEDAKRALMLTIGSAFELPVSLQFVELYGWRNLELHIRQRRLSYESVADLQTNHRGSRSTDPATRRPAKFLTSKQCFAPLLAHAQVVAPEDIGYCRDLGVIASMQAESL